MTPVENNKKKSKLRQSNCITNERERMGEVKEGGRENKIEKEGEGKRGVE